MLRLISRLRNPLRSLPQTGTYQHHIGSPLLPPSNCHLSHPFSSSRSTPDEEGGDGPESSLGASVVGHDQDRPPRLFVVQPRLRPESTLRAKLSEALNLANSLEEPRDGRYMEAFEEKKTPPHSIVQNPLARSGGHADTFFGKGTVENIKREILALDSEPGPDAIFVNSVLSGIQQRNLERTWGMPVIDRVGLIIEIFNAHAQTKEAKLQSELAALIYKRTRLVRLRGPGGRLTFGTMGESEVVSAKGKGSGGRGFLSGAGESEIQLQRHRIQQRREQLLHEIEEVRRTRALQRNSRKKHGSDGLATIAIVGYTNAGKSTLVSALSRNDVYSDDRLFATVDPRLRSVILPSGRKVLLSDTVGFISDLPIQLIEAFHATLEEVVHADLLVHVLDSSASNVDDQRLTVLDVLKQIGVSDEKIQNMVEVWNKIDLLEKKSMTAEMLDDIENSANDEDQDEWSTSSENELVSEQGVTGDVEDDLLLEGCEGEDFKWDEDRKINSKLCLEVHKSEVDAADGGESMSCSGGEPVKESMPSAEQIPKEPDTESLDTMKDGSALTSLEDDNNHLCRGSKEDDVVSSTIMLGDIRRIQTSAVTGVGLQEVLGIMDEKLSIIDQRLHSQNANSSTGASLFERKWRPSYGRASDKETATV